MNIRKQIRLPKNIIRSEPPTEQMIRAALEEFDALLNQHGKNRAPTEHEWQHFFDENPFVLGRAVNLTFDGLFPQVRLTSGRVDYLFHKTAISPFFSTTGFIELKRPDHSILDVYNSGSQVAPARHLSRAYSQTCGYLKDIENTVLVHNGVTLSCGNNRIVLIIIGTTHELMRKLHDEMAGLFDNLLPPGFRVITYDHLFDLLKDAAPPAVQVLVAKHPVFVANDPTQIMASLRIVLDYQPIYDKYYLTDGSEGYGDQVFEKGTGAINIGIPGKSILDLSSKALQHGKAEIEIETDIEDRLGSPGYPDYLWYENNVKQYHGKANIRLEITEGEPVLSYELPEHDRHKWSGW